MNAGDNVPGTTTLAALLDLIYTNRTASLTSASAVFTALDKMVVQASWPGANDVIRFKFEARALPPEFINL